MLVDYSVFRCLWCRLGVVLLEGVLLMLILGCVEVGVLRFVGILVESEFKMFEVLKDVLSFEFGKECLHFVFDLEGIPTEVERKG